MKSKVLIVPGYRGSGLGHWQTWLEQRISGSERIQGIDWDAPSLPRWSETIGRAIDASPRPVWIVAHSFGCLATVTAAYQQPSKVAGVILVAPADPERFSLHGLRTSGDRVTEESILGYLPRGQLNTNGLLVASQNDPWLGLDDARCMADRWHLPLYNAGKVGHINTESGFGPWPFLFNLLSAMEGETVSTSSNVKPIHGEGFPQKRRKNAEYLQQKLAYL